MLLLDQLDAEALWDHRQRSESPSLPTSLVVLRLLERAEVTIGPGDGIAIALDIARASLSGSEYLGYVTRYGWFLSDADDHSGSLTH